MPIPKQHIVSRSFFFGGGGGGGRGVEGTTSWVLSFPYGSVVPGLQITPSWANPVALPDQTSALFISRIVIMLRDKLQGNVARNTVPYVCFFVASEFPHRSHAGKTTFASVSIFGRFRLSKNPRNWRIRREAIECGPLKPIDNLPYFLFRPFQFRHLSSFIGKR